MNLTAEQKATAHRMIVESLALTPSQEAALAALPRYDKALECGFTGHMGSVAFLLEKAGIPWSYPWSQ
jgi:hypothetical protein